MDGVTDASFRYITARYGKPDVTFTEFVNIQAAFYAPQTFFRDFAYCEIERPVVALDDEDHRSLRQGDVVSVDATGDPATLHSGLG